MTRFTPTYSTHELSSRHFYLSDAKVPKTCPIEDMSHPLNLKTPKRLDYHPFLQLDEDRRSIFSGLLWY